MVPGERDMETYLAVLGVTKHESSSNLVLGGLGKILHSTVCHSGTLAVTSHDDSRVRALAGGLLDEVAHFASAPAVGATGESVGADKRSIGDALDSNAVIAEAGLEAIGGGRANDGTHITDLAGATGEDHDDVAAAAVGELGGTTSDAALAGDQGRGHGGGCESEDGDETHVRGVLRRIREELMNRNERFEVGKMSEASGREEVKRSTRT